MGRACTTSKRWTSVTACSASSTTWSRGAGSNARSDKKSRRSRDYWTPVNGAAVGIGTTLLLHCDLVYCADDSRFSLPFVNLGLCPEFGSSLLLPLAAGYHRAAEKLLLGEPASAEEALEMGLVNRILPPAEVLGHAQRRCARLAQLPPAALRETKRLLKEGWRSATERAISEESVAFGRLLGSAEAREAFSAFLDRRPPDFSKSH